MELGLACAASYIPRDTMRRLHARSVTSLYQTMGSQHTNQVMNSTLKVYPLFLFQEAIHIFLGTRICEAFDYWQFVRFLQS